MDLGIVLRTPQGQLVTLAMSYNVDRPSMNECLIVGEESTLLYENGSLATRDRVLYTPPQGEGNMREAIFEQDREFVAAVSRGARVWRSAPRRSVRRWPCSRRCRTEPRSPSAIRVQLAEVSL